MNEIYCGRGPAIITFSPAAAAAPSNWAHTGTRDAIGQANEAGFDHCALGLPERYPLGVAQRVADELITKST
ncbi:hypothetical protein [Mycolicibacterium sarraceniae]|uniref:Uncharacterized protein n=1 Tax=Mycolicibacterium sarraceniae TaxID=1534348 RepID=A0A7I7STP1_9MYCO|nr:hypothetical protein [Mycolicibacterium sarraceniae]BBY60372.1 hypothetical protein MSAR_35080 [Mycolicibacterium sarraceniae]